MFRRNCRQKVATPDDQPIVLRIHAIPMVSEQHNYLKAPISSQGSIVPKQPAVLVEYKNSNSAPFRTPAVHLEHKIPDHEPITTQPGSQVKKPDRLIEKLTLNWTEDVVISFVCWFLVFIAVGFPASYVNGQESLR